MSTPVPTPPSITDWLTAIGTVGAVIVALFIASLGTLLSRYRKPVLKIEFENTEPFCRHATIWGVGPPAIGYFLRLRVRNTGKSMARDCEGKLVRIFDAEPRYERTDFDPANLLWVGHRGENAISIHKKAYEYLGVLSVQNRTPAISLGVNEQEPRGISLALPRQDYILDIVIFGKNTEPVEKFFRLHIEAGFAVGYDRISLEEVAV